MILYFSSPVALVIAYAIFSSDLRQAIFVKPHNRGNEGSKLHLELISQLQKISQIVAHSLGVSFTQISFKDYLLVKPDIIESSLAINSNGANGIIINGSDSYCIFGFNNYFRFLRTKIKLKRLFRNNFRVHSKAILYSYTKHPEKLKSQNEAINQFEVVQLLNRLAPKVFEGLGQNIESIINQDCILVLPPIHKYTGNDFSLRFMKSVEIFAKEHNLKVFVKPHRNDETNYTLSLIDKSLLLGDKLDFRTVPVEFFFTLKHVLYIMAVPSSSLALSKEINSQVLVPKNRQLFRKSFLDQVPFLESIGIKVQKI